MRRSGPPPRPDYEAYNDAVPVTVAVMPVTIAAITPSRLTGTRPGAPITWTVTASGGVEALQYRFFWRNLDTGEDWTRTNEYGSSNT